MLGGWSRSGGGGSSTTSAPRTTTASPSGRRVGGGGGGGQGKGQGQGHGHQRRGRRDSDDAGSGGGSRGSGPGGRSRTGDKLRRQVVVLLTDGNSNKGGDPSGCAKLLTASGIEVFAVGIGSGISRAELQSVASHGDAKHVLSVRGFDALDEILDQLEGVVCPGKW